MIPNISARDIKKAVRRIDREGVDRRRASTKFCLTVGDCHYPPKYVVSLAVEQARGRPLTPQEFSGGDETNAVLIGLGFKVAACNCGGLAEKQAVLPGSRTPARLRTPHSSADSASKPISIGRVVVQGEPPRDPAAAEATLLNIFTRKWPPGARVKFLITPGGFVSSGWPCSWSGRVSWQSRPADLTELVATAERVINRVVTKRVLAAAADKAEVLTIGIDLFAYPDPEHVELVAVFDIQAAKLVQWTGKSYPTSGQEKTLVQVADLKTHLLSIAGERVLVLGCHDLNMFSPRGRANQDPNGVRRKRCDEMAAMVQQFRPSVVLQHPHSTDTPNIWRLPWSLIHREIPSVRVWASGIGYYNRHGSLRAPLTEVLQFTQGGETCLDIVTHVSV
jgi:hypothetical protein